MNSHNSGSRVPILMFLAFLVPCLGQNASSQQETIAAPAVRRTSLSLADVENRLQKLATSKPPTSLSKGTPQVQPPLPDSVIYFCPVCGSKTMYKRPEPVQSATQKKTGNRQSWSWNPAADTSRSRLEDVIENDEAAQPVWELGDMVARQVPACRELTAEIRASGLYTKLDESRFCDKCAGDSTSNAPYLTFTFQYAGAKQGRRLSKVKSDDLRLIAEFLGGKKIHVASDGVQSPLKDHLKSLSFLLGIQLPTQ
jgi:hypothetical protein